MAATEGSASLAVGNITGTKDGWSTQGTYVNNLVYLPSND